MPQLPAPLQRLSSLLNSDTFQQLKPGEETLAGLDLFTQAEMKQASTAEQATSIQTLMREWYNTSRGARYQFEQQWYKNLDMAQGRQFSYWDDNKKQMVASTPQDSEPRIPINIIEPVMRTELAKTGSSHPSVSVSPASNDDEDIMAAQAAEKVWAWFYDTSDFQSTVFNPANYWRAHTGMGFIKTFVDFSCEDPAAMEAAKRASNAEQATLEGAAANSMIPYAAPQPKVKPITGKITAEPVSPFNLYVGDLLQPNLQKQPYIIHAYTMPLEQAKYQYKDYLPDNWAPARSSAAQLLDATHIGIRGGNDQLKDQVLVTETYVRRGITPKMPNGGMVIMVADQVVTMTKDGLPYEHGMFPFAALTGIETGQFYRKSVVSSLTPLQDEMNRIFAQLIKYKNMVVRPQMFYDEGSVDPTRVRSKAGLWIPIRLGMKRPEAVQLPPLPQAVPDLINRLREIMDDISGQHQVSRAQAPGADTAASALSLLQETDDNFLAPTYDSIELCLRHVGKFVLSNAQQFWDEPRYVKVTGDDSSVDAQILSGADLKNGTDVRVDTGSGLPESKSAKIAVITDWMKNGFISPQLGMQALNMGMLGKIYNLLRIDEDQATRENLSMRNLDPAQLQQAQMQHDATQAQATDPAAIAQAGGNPFAGISDPGIGLQADPAAAQAMQPQPFVAFPINSYDNDAVHIEVHKREMKSQGYEAYTPEIKQVFEAHLAAHETRFSQSQMQQSMMGMPAQDPAASAPGTPPGYAGDQSMQPLAA